MLESKFKKKIQDDMKKSHGWIFIQLDPGAGVPMGFPDTLALSPTGYHCFIEWKKSRDSKKQPLQEHYNTILNAMGHDTFFAYPENWEEARERIIRKSRELSDPAG